MDDFLTVRHARRLAAAIIKIAVRDAKSNDHWQARMAQRFLVCDGGFELARALGISQSKIDAMVEEEPIQNQGQVTQPTHPPRPTRRRPCQGTNDRMYCTIRHSSHAHAPATISVRRVWSNASAAS
jgi:hypothetical protein